MISALRTRGASRRGVLAFALVVAGVASVAARPFAPAPGLTYRVRMVVTPPDIPGMPAMGPTIVVGRGASIGAQSRMDIDSVTGQLPLAIGDYILSLDSGRTVMVSPTAKTYSEGLAGMTALPPELLAQASVTNVNVTTEKLGAGETMQGYATEKVRMTVTYALSLMGQTMNTMSVMEMSLAQLPAAIVTPFDGNLPKEMSEGPMKELAAKMVAARKALGTATALKTVTTSSITGPMSVTTTTTLELLDVKAGDVDPATLKVPEGFTKKP
jgi:hypothetical protein